MQQLFDELCLRLDATPPLAVVVSIELQRLGLYRDGVLAQEWPVSTSRFGTGSQMNSFRTPLGLHRIAEKIGAGTPLNTVFKGRKPLDRTKLNPLRPTQDLIMSRILWLDGCERGLNRGGDMDSHNRYIYIHGTTHEDRIGTPDSHGCVRMRNADVVALFDLVESDTPVFIG